MKLRAALATLLAVAALAGCGPGLPLSQPQWSADGAHVVFVHYSVDAPARLYAVKTGTDDAPALVAEGVERFAVSGESLYFLRGRAEGDGPAAARPGLYSLELARTGEPKARAKLLLPAPDGRRMVRVQAAAGLLYVECHDDDGKSLLIELDPAGGGERAISPAGANTQWTGAIASPRGGRLAVFAPAKDGALEIVASRPAEEDAEPAVLGSLGQAEADGAGMAWSRSGEHLAAWYTEKAGGEAGDGAEAQSTARLAVFEPAKGDKARREVELPSPGSPVVTASFSPDGRRLLFTVLAEKKDNAAQDGAEGDPATESFELDLSGGKPKSLGLATGKLVGARAYSPDNRQYVEFGPGGLALFEAGGAAPARVWPLDFAERTAGIRAAMAGGNPARAAELAAAALESSGAFDDRSELARLRADALEAAGRPSEAATAYVESLLRYPVTARREPAAQAAKRLAKYTDACPDDRLLFALAEAWKTRAAGKASAAAAELKAAAALSADRAWCAGINFAAAEALLDDDKPLAAGELFRKSSDVADFPQADWAGALAAAAYALAGRDDLAAEELQRCRDLFPKSALAADFEAMTKSVTAPATRARTAEETKAPDGASSARLEAWPATGLHLSFAPSRTPAGAEARIAVLRYERWRLVLSPPEGGDKVLADGIPVPLERLAFSPEGKRLAFLAGEGDERSLYAVDLAGAALLGDLRKLAEGQADPKTRAADYRWPEDGGLPEAVKGE